MSEIVPENFYIGPSKIFINTSRPFAIYFDKIFYYLTSKSILEIEQLTKLIILYCQKDENHGYGYWKTFSIAEINTLRQDLKINEDIAHKYYFDCMVKANLLIVDKKFNERYCASREFVLNCYKYSSIK